MNLINDVVSKTLLIHMDIISKLKVYYLSLTFCASDASQHLGVLGNGDETLSWAALKVQRHYNSAHSPSCTHYDRPSVWVLCSQLWQVQTHCRWQHGKVSSRFHLSSFLSIISTWFHCAVTAERMACWHTVWQNTWVSTGWSRVLVELCLWFHDETCFISSGLCVYVHFLRSRIITA